MSQIGIIGIIGGSGVYNIAGIKIINEHFVETPFGVPSDNVVEASLDGNTFFFIPRHGRTHGKLPHEVNYRANIFALKSLGVEYVISVSAVGSLKEEHNPTSFVLPSQFIDWTKGQRERTFFGNGIIAHVSTAVPVDPELQGVLASACEKSSVKFHKGGSYVCIEGPQFSSKGESEIYRSFGADVIGMTNVPESYLAKEAGMAYATIAMVTDYDCWKEEHCSVDEIMKVAKTNNETVQDVIKFALDELTKNPINFIKENKFGILSPLDSLTDEQKYIVEVLIK